MTEGTFEYSPNGTDWATEEDYLGKMKDGTWSVPKFKRAWTELVAVTEDEAAQFQAKSI